MSDGAPAPTPFAATLEGLSKPLRQSEEELPIPEAVMNRIKAELADSVADGIEKGVKRLEQRYSSIQTWSKIQVGATIVVAVAAVTIVVLLLAKK